MLAELPCPRCGRVRCPGAASGPWPRGENGGEWFSKLANLRDGSAPPADAPGWMINVAGGNKYELGNYDTVN